MAGGDAVRPPAQDRSRKAWARVLAIGADILETQGADAFTIAEVCRQAEVSVAAIYARVSGKDALLLAAYDEVRRRIDQERSRTRQDEAAPSSSAEAVDRAVASLADLFLSHATFMRSVILLSGTHREIRLRGSDWTRQLGHEFAAALAPHARHFAVEDHESSIDLCYRLVFSAAVMHVVYGSGFASDRELTDAELVNGLKAAVRRTLNVS